MIGTHTWRILYTERERGGGGRREGGGERERERERERRERERGREREGGRERYSTESAQYSDVMSSSLSHIT